MCSANLNTVLQLQDRELDLARRCISSSERQAATLGRRCLALDTSTHKQSCIGQSLSNHIPVPILCPPPSLDPSRTNSSPEPEPEPLSSTSRNFYNWNNLPKVLRRYGCRFYQGPCGKDSLPELQHWFGGLGLVRVEGGGSGSWLQVFWAFQDCADHSVSMESRDRLAKKRCSSNRHGRTVTPANSLGAVASPVAASAPQLLRLLWVRKQNSKQDFCKKHVAFICSCVASAFCCCVGARGQ